MCHAAWAGDRPVDIRRNGSPIRRAPRDFLYIIYGCWKHGSAITPRPSSISSRASDIRCFRLFLFPRCCWTDGKSLLIGRLGVTFALIGLSMPTLCVNGGDMKGPRSAPPGLKANTGPSSMATSPLGDFVHTPLKRSDGSWVLVNRGWAPRSKGTREKASSYTAQSRREVGVPFRYDTLLLFGAETPQSCCLVL